MFFMLLFLNLIFSRNTFGNEERKDFNISTPVSVNQIITKTATNITLPCLNPNQNDSVYWERSGSHKSSDELLSDNSLFLVNLTTEDSKQYTCRRSEDDQLIAQYFLEVRGPPPSLKNVSVVPGRRDVLVSWTSSWSGERTAPAFVSVRYRLLGASQDWRLFSESIPEEQEFTRLFDLLPNRTYEFEVSSHNEYGRSKNIFLHATTNAVQLFRSSGPVSWVSLRSLLVGLASLLFVVNLIGVVFLFFISWNNRRISGKGDNCEQIELIPNVIENPAVSDSESEYSTDPVGGTACSIRSLSVVTAAHKAGSKTRRGQPHSDFV